MPANTSLSNTSLSNTDNIIKKLNNSIKPKTQPKAITTKKDSNINDSNKYTYKRKITSFYNENKKKVIALGGLLAVVVLTVVIVSTRKSETPEEKAIRLENEKIKNSIKNKINEYKRKNEAFMLSENDYRSKEKVIDKLIINNLSNIKYKKKTNKNNLEFSLLDEILQYEQSLNNTQIRDTIYNNALNSAIATIKSVGDALGSKLLVGKTMERINSANVSYRRNRTESDKIIYKYLSHFPSTINVADLSKYDFNFPSNNLTQLFDLVVNNMDNFALRTLYGSVYTGNGAYGEIVEIMN